MLVDHTNKSLSIIEDDNHKKLGEEDLDLLCMAMEEISCTEDEV